MQSFSQLFKWLFCLIVLAPCTNIHAVNIQSEPQTDSRPYNAALTLQQKKDIQYIILTLGTKSYFSLLMEQRALTDAGNRTAEVHPLKFLEYVFSDPELRKAAKNIKGIPWNRFAGDMANSLKEEYKNGALSKEELKSFSQTTGIPENSLITLYEKKQWKELVMTMQKTA